MPNKNTLFVGKVSHDLPQVESTNNYALALLTKSKPSEGTVISTFVQTAGRGQIGNKWESAPGQNIAFSVIFYPRFLPVSQQFFLIQAVSLAVCDTLAPLLLPAGPRIKWPNDIYVGPRKVTGILIQNTVNSTGIQSSVVGIGINVNQTEFSPKLPNPTSLQIETGRSFDLYQIMEDLCFHLESCYLQLRAGQFADLNRAYHEKLYARHEERPFQLADGSVLQGAIAGVDPAGRLQIQTAAGVIKSFAMKEIRFLEDPGSKAVPTL